MQDLREANSTSPTSELETGELRDFQPREENFQRQLRYVQQREENLQIQFRELREREQSSQRQLTESRQREQNLKRQKMKFSDPRGELNIDEGKHALAHTLLDLLNSSYPTRPHSLITKYCISG